MGLPRHGEGEVKEEEEEEEEGMAQTEKGKEGRRLCLFAAFSSYFEKVSFSKCFLLFGLLLFHE